MKLYIDTSNRFKRIVRLNGQVIETEGDVLVAIDKLLKAAGCGLNVISKIEVNLGPGSFTGLRVGVSIANALNYALGLVNLRKLFYPQYGKPPKITLKKKGVLS